MYTPSRQVGRVPRTLRHRVPGVSRTGEKLPAKTNLGSTDGFSGFSMKLLMTSSAALQKSDARAWGAGTFLEVWVLNDCTVAGFFVDFKGWVGVSCSTGRLDFLSEDVGAEGFAPVWTLDTIKVRG